jgi:T5SS/PEP-CTERM-associated repeat protein
MTIFALRNRGLVRVTLAIAAILSGVVAPTAAWAVVAAQGDVSPVPAAGGGNVAAPFRIGNTGYGSLNVEPPVSQAPSPITVTGGGVIIGDSATGEGLAVFTGFGNNLTASVAGADLTIGNQGRGSLSVANSARFTIADDLFIANGASATGSLFISGFGSTVAVDDTLLIGSGGTAFVQVSASGRLTGDDTILGQLAGSDGRLTVSGVASN